MGSVSEQAPRPKAPWLRVSRNPHPGLPGLALPCQAVRCRSDLAGGAGAWVALGACVPSVRGESQACWQGRACGGLLPCVSGGWSLRSTSTLCKSRKQPVEPAECGARRRPEEALTVSALCGVAHLWRAVIMVFVAPSRT